MKLGILKTDTVRPEWVPQFGEYPDMFAALLGGLDPTIEFVTYDVESGVFPESVDEVDAYLITGSKSSVYDDKDWIRKLENFVRDLHDHKKKLVGICFGHQIIARALGGLAEKSSKGWGVGLHTHQFTRSAAWHDQGEANFNILVSHQDQVTRLPEGATALAGSEFCENAVSQIGDHILTFQGHPEFVLEYSREIMEFRRGMIGEEVYCNGIASLASAPENERIGGWILNFLNR
ncbi:MAG: GMP synthase-like glutamine amidotransferase [Halieaceae bacterium]|jgi:GMP synthase-like glutamine amidotransferase